MFPRITAVRYLHDYTLELTFSNGLCGELDFRSRIAGRGGVFTALQDPACFSQAQVDPEAGALVWPNGVDFCPDVLYSAISGEPISLLEHA